MTITLFLFSLLSELDLSFLSTTITYFAILLLPAPAKHVPPQQVTPPLPAHKMMINTQTKQPTKQQAIEPPTIVPSASVELVELREEL